MQKQRWWQLCLTSFSSAGARNMLVLIVLPFNAWIGRKLPLRGARGSAASPWFSFRKVYNWKSRVKDMSCLMSIKYKWPISKDVKWNTCSFQKGYTWRRVSKLTVKWTWQLVYLLLGNVDWFVENHPSDYFTATRSCLGAFISHVSNGFR